jgi:hypothetical protein
VRRKVLAHGVLAFVFNALTIAVAITFVTSYIATRWRLVPALPGGFVPRESYAQVSTVW